MYSPKYNLVFIHNKKVAGTSFKTAISEADPFIARRRFDAGFTDSELKEFIDSCKPTVVTITRNPWDRFVSAWQWCVSTRHRPLNQVLTDLPGKDLILSARDAKYLRSKIWMYIEYLHREHLGHYQPLLALAGKRETIWRQDHDYEHLTHQQIDRFVDPEFEYPVRRLNFENLEFEANELFLDLGINARLPKLNTSKSSVVTDYRRVFVEELRDRFSTLFPEDSKILGYKFEEGPGVPPWPSS